MHNLHSIRSKGHDFQILSFVQINISVTQTRKDMPILSVTMKIEIVGDCKRTNLLIALLLELQC